ncbi:hypothetical protein ABPG72_018694 [Tetrahymena utriculariae]
MKEEVKFTDYLEDIEFKKWAVVISNLVWKKSFREIGEHLNCTYQWDHKIVQKFISEGKMIDRREYNGGNNLKLNEEVLGTIEQTYQENRSSINREVIAEIQTQHGVSICEKTLKTAKKTLEIQFAKQSLKKISLPEFEQDEEKDALQILMNSQKLKQRNEKEMRRQKKKKTQKRLSLLCQKTSNNSDSKFKNADCKIAPYSDKSYDSDEDNKTSQLEQNDSNQILDHGKQTRQQYSSQFKSQVIKHTIAHGTNNASIYYQVPYYTIKNWRQKQDPNEVIIYLRQFNKRPIKFESIEELLFQQIMETRNQGIPVSLQFIFSRAKQIANQQGLIAFNTSKNWASGFLNRKNLSLRKKTNDFRVDHSEMEKKVFKYQQDLKENRYYEKYDLIINMDESAFFSQIISFTHMTQKDNSAFLKKFLKIKNPRKRKVKPKQQKWKIKKTRVGVQHQLQWVNTLQIMLSRVNFVSSGRSTSCLRGKQCRFQHRCVATVTKIKIPKQESNLVTVMVTQVISLDPEKAAKYVLENQDKAIGIILDDYQLLAPTKDIVNDCRKKRAEWPDLERIFKNNIEQKLEKKKEIKNPNGNTQGQVKLIHQLYIKEMKKALLMIQYGTLIVKQAIQAPDQYFHTQGADRAAKGDETILLAQPTKRNRLEYSQPKTQQQMQNEQMSKLNTQTIALMPIYKQHKKRPNTEQLKQTMITDYKK